MAGQFNHALLSWHEGHHAHRLAAIDSEIRRGVADPENGMAVAGIEPPAQNAPNEPPRDLAEGRGVEGAQIDDVESHGVG